VEALADAYGQMLARLKRLLPPPAPVQGWGLVRLMAMARLLGPMAENRFALAQYGLRLGAAQTRNDPNASSWETDASTWTFDIAAETGGSEGLYLDAWGRILGVPRILNETDTHYCQRILFESVQASQSNRGLAATIENHLGITGVSIVDALSGVVTILRLNEGLQLNNSVQLNLAYFGNSTLTGSGSLAGCFFTIVPAGTSYDQTALLAIVDSHKAAGTRHLGILSGSSSSTPTVPTAAITLSARTDAAGTPGITATVTATALATYTWTILNVTITAGQGTDQITFTLGASGTCTVACTVANSAGSAAASAAVTVTS
jgi:hypothetical protein